MNIIIAGAGKVGTTLAELLAAEDHNVTIVDNHSETLDKISDHLDVMCVKGNCASKQVLQRAGAETADVLIACTNLDEINILCCHCAHQIGVGYTVARVRDTEYTTDVQALKNDLGINMIINPERAAAEEISRLLRFPSAANIDTFARGRVEIIGFHILEEDGLAGRAISALSSRIRGLPLLFCAVERNNSVFIPNGSTVFSVGDKVYVAGTPAGIHQLFKLLGRDARKIHNVFIVGGSRIAYYLLNILDRLGLNGKLIEKNESRCRIFAEHYPHSLIIHGDGTDPELLIEERLSASDAFISLTDRDEYKQNIALYAHQCGVSKVIAKSNRQNYFSIAKSAGLESIVSPKLTTAYQILRTVRGIQNSKGNVMTALYKIADGHAEAMEFVVGPSTRNLGTPLKDLKLKKGILISVLVRGNQVIIPEGSTYMQEGDTVIVVARNSGIMDLNDIFADFSIGG